MFFFHIFLLIVPLSVTQAEYCPDNCKCDFASYRDANCTINNGTFKLKLAMWPSRFSSLIVTCEGTNFTCPDLPQLGAREVYHFQSMSCPPSVLRCVNRILLEPVIESITLSNVSEAISKDEDLKHFANVSYLELKLKDAGMAIPIAVINSWSSLLWVSLSKGNLQMLPNTFNHSSLVILKMIENNLTNWTQGAFSGLPNLKKLAMYYGHVERDFINAGTFKGLTKLRQLWLKNMSLRRILPGAFIDTPKLEVLNLDQNPFESLPNGFLAGLESLKSIVITCVSTKNQGLNLGSHAFANQSKLREVELGLCKLNNISDNLFSDSNNITSIDIGDNIIKDISAKIFSNLTCIKRLKFDNNGVDELPKGIFDNLKSLEILSLANNGIVKLHETIFATLSSLISLNLAQNKIAELPSKIFKSLSSLEVLNLNDNNIHVLPGNIFRGLSNLEILNLANNSIQELPADIFAPLTNLEDLDLKNNRIRRLPENIFTGFSLISLNIANNSILPLDKNSFKHIFKLVT